MLIAVAVQQHQSILDFANVSFLFYVLKHFYLDIRLDILESFSHDVFLAAKKLC